MSKAQFINICHHVPIITTWQIYSRLTPVTLIAISSTYSKQQVTPLFSTGETTETFYFFKKH